MLCVVVATATVSVHAVRTQQFFWCALQRIMSIGFDTIDDSAPEATYIFHSAGEVLDCDAMAEFNGTVFLAGRNTTGHSFLWQVNMTQPEDRADLARNDLRFFRMGGIGNSTLCPGASTRVSSMTFSRTGEIRAVLWNGGSAGRTCEVKFNPHTPGVVIDLQLLTVTTPMTGLVQIAYSPIRPLNTVSNLGYYLLDSHLGSVNDTRQVVGTLLNNDALGDAEITGPCTRSGYVLPCGFTFDYTGDAYVMWECQGPSGGHEILLTDMSTGVGTNLSPRHLITSQARPRGLFMASPCMFENPCPSNATCVSAATDNGYECICPYGSEGPGCHDIDECASNPCQNGGTCENLQGRFRCTCDGNDYHGLTCKTYDPTPKGFLCTHEYNSRLYRLNHTTGVTELVGTLGPDFHYCSGVELYRQDLYITGSLSNGSQALFVADEATAVVRAFRVLPFLAETYCAGPYEIRDMATAPESTAYHMKLMINYQSTTAPYDICTFFIDLNTDQVLEGPPADGCTVAASNHTGYVSQNLGSPGNYIDQGANCNYGLFPDGTFTGSESNGPLSFAEFDALAAFPCDAGTRYTTGATIGRAELNWVYVILVCSDLSNAKHWYLGYFDVLVGEFRSVQQIPLDLPYESYSLSVYEPECFAHDAPCENGAGCTNLATGYQPWKYCHDCPLGFVGDRCQTEVDVCNLWYTCSANGVIYVRNPDGIEAHEFQNFGRCGGVVFVNGTLYAYADGLYQAGYRVNALWIIHPQNLTIVSMVAEDINPCPGLYIGDMEYERATDRFIITQEGGSCYAEINPHTGASAVRGTTISEAGNAVAFYPNQTVLWQAGSTNIHSINPTTGVLLGTYSAITFPADTSSCGSSTPKRVTGMSPNIIGTPETMSVTYRCGAIKGGTGTLDLRTGVIVRFSISGSCCPLDGVVRASLLSDCVNGGVCSDGTGTPPVCSCPSGFSGQKCETPNSPCLGSTDCQHGATCVDIGGGLIRCDCAAGYEGTVCESIVDNCLPTPCHNGGTCHNQINSFNCTCPAGTSTPVCDDLTNECSSIPCQNGGSCADGINGYQCRCVSGFSGVNCQTDVNECASGPCIFSGACVDLVNSYRCDCAPGYYEAAGSVCTPCIAGTFNPLSAKTTCPNCLPGSYQPSSHQTSCVFCDPNTFNSDFGATGCAHCPANFYQPLSNSTSCIPCPVGYAGVDCVTDVNECASLPCRNGGTCRDRVNGFNCTCPAGRSGVLCQTDVNECASSPCRNGGTCSDLVNSFYCTCVAGFSGTTCQTGINECSSAPCRNGATCADGSNRYDCVCAAGYSGLQCQTNINECASTPCRHGGVCYDLPNSFYCACAVGYSGLLCQTDINECASEPCQNGTCVDRPNGFLCICADGFNGTLCSISNSTNATVASSSSTAVSELTTASDVGSDGLTDNQRFWVVVGVVAFGVVGTVALFAWLGTTYLGYTATEAAVVPVFAGIGRGGPIDYDPIDNNDHDAFQNRLTTAMTDTAASDESSDELSADD